LDRVEEFEGVWGFFKRLKGGEGRKGGKMEREAGMVLKAGFYMFVDCLTCNQYNAIC